MPFVSVTRLHLASRWSFPRFVYYALGTSKQARRSRGFLAGWTSTDGEFGFWTSTVWDSLEAMRAFRNSAVHLKAMPKLLHMCDQAAYTHFEQSASDVPTAEVAYQVLSREGKMSKVNAPSPQHLAGQRVGSSVPRAQHWSPRAAV